MSGKYRPPILLPDGLLISTMAQRTAGESHAGGQSLRPFEGRIILGINFETDHSLWLYDFERTPTEYDSYREFWVVEPDDTRSLYYDTDGAEEEIEAFHDWERAVLAEMTWDWTTDRIDITVDGEDGRSIELDGTVRKSAMSRVLTVMQRYLPGPLHKRMFGKHTETGKFGQLDTPSVRVVTEASARIDGTSLGSVHSPAEPVSFGEVESFDNPYVFEGSLLLEYPA